jgi:hypothetical protein
VKKTICSLLLLGCQLANATIIEGSFSGQVYNANGISDNGLDLASLIGLPISGIFSFESDTLPLIQGGTGATHSEFSSSNSGQPAFISDTVGGITFTMNGTVRSYLVVDAIDNEGHVENYFRLSAQNIDNGVVVTGDFIGAIVFGLRDFLPMPFLADMGDAGSTSFAYHNPYSSTPGASDGAGGENIFVPSGEGNNIQFFITDASARPVSVPEPGSLSLLATGLLGLAAMRKQRGESRSDNGADIRVA